MIRQVNEYFIVIIFTNLIPQQCRVCKRLKRKRRGLEEIYTHFSNFTYMLTQGCGQWNPC